jgi:hypothetical protein
MPGEPRVIVDLKGLTKNCGQEAPESSQGLRMSGAACSGSDNLAAEARQSIGRYLAFYNARPPHTALDQHTPDQAYFEPLPLRTAA